MSNVPTRYALQLEMLEQSGVIGDEQAIELVRSEFALAQNAGRFAALTPDDIVLGAVSRSTPQEGVTRYDIELILVERDESTDDRRAQAQLCRAFTDALNASYFVRVCEDALTLRLVSRAPLAAPVASAA
jgi:hypothetical protein